MNADYQSDHRPIQVEIGRREKRKAAPGPHEPDPPTLPDLAPVTGWSQASGKPAYNEKLAMFGGWWIGGERG